MLEIQRNLWVVFWTGKSPGELNVESVVEHEISVISFVIRNQKNNITISFLIPETRDGALENNVSSIGGGNKYL